MPDNRRLCSNTETSTVGIGHYIKEIGRGVRGARPLTRVQAEDLFGQVLDGAVSDLEIGAFCIAMRVKGETADEMSGFLDATHARLLHLPATQRPLIVLPSYNGARRLPVLTPLLALLLGRAGLPVLVHGTPTEARRITAAQVLAQLGLAAISGAEAQQRPLANGEVAHIDTGELLPGLKRLLQVREVIGLRNPGHSVVKLMQPGAGVQIIVSSYTHAEYFKLLCATFAQRGSHALLSRGLEGEVVSDPRRSPQIDGFLHGHQQLLEAPRAGTLDEVPGLPQSIDAASTAAYTRRVLDGELPLPASIARQVQHICDWAERL